jgi:hypothetical protein
MSGFILPTSVGSNCNADEDEFIRPKPSCRVAKQDAIERQVKQRERKESKESEKLKWSDH